MNCRKSHTYGEFRGSLVKVHILTHVRINFTQTYWALILLAKQWLLGMGLRDVSQFLILLQSLRSCVNFWKSKNCNFFLAKSQFFVKETLVNETSNEPQFHYSMPILIHLNWVMLIFMSAVLVVEKLHRQIRFRYARFRHFSTFKVFSQKLKQRREAINSSKRLWECVLQHYMSDFW